MRYEPAAADAAVRFVRGYSLEQYLADEKTRAVGRVLELCDEAMNGEFGSRAQQVSRESYSVGLPVMQRVLTVRVVAPGVQMLRDQTLEGKSIDLGG